MAEEKDKKTIPERCAGSIALIEFLSKVPEESVISYETLSTICGKNVKEKGRYLLYSARRNLQEESRIVFECVHRQGIKRLKDESLVDAGNQYLRKCRRIISDKADKLDCIQNYEALPEEKKVKLNSERAIIRLASNVMTRRFKNRVLETVQGIQGPISLEGTLALFSGTIKKEKEEKS